ncbi:unnamed protein product [Arctia plantaginis]|uniref:Protein NRDE2 homolog n=1 Tax=Arctia plantaginis TaxID=874455 RepID=A0A8S1AMS7_ARCPL|nr:unnamed protein product [Arctia plantaginis]
MSLFPAYAQDSSENNVDQEVVCMPESSSVTLAQEAQLLESESDEERQTAASAVSPVPVEPSSCQLNTDEYYLDRKFDCGNLRVSTLYYPGRPQYETQKRAAVGLRKSEGRGVKRRYFEVSLDVLPDSLMFDEELAVRNKAYRQMLTDQPTDEALWLRFIEFQERCRDAEAAMVAAESARERLPNSSRIRGALYRLRSRVLVPRRRLALLREDLAKCSKPDQNTELTTELWLRLLDTVAQCGDGTELEETAAAALGATRAFPSAYPHILYVYGGYLRSAGLWERLVLLLELVASMNFPPGVFPPAPDAERLERVEQELQDTEDKAIASGLPLSTVWVRVERARAAAHWRAPPLGEGGAAALDAGADPQRTPLAADVAELLLPARADDAPLLLLQALRLAKVPLLPAAGYVAAALDPSNDAMGDSRWAACGEALLSLVRAARRLPAAHPARAHGAAGARALLAHFVDPPHYFTDDTGYLTWVSSLWEAGCSWTSGAARVAILCWRLRWMHSLLLLLDTQEEADAKEARRIRSEARLALKRWAGSSPLPFAQFARLEQAAAGPEHARRAGLQALRAALRDRDTPPAHRLYIARVVGEVCSGAAGDCAGAWATACSALHRDLPDDEQLATPPPQELLDAALSQCETECEQVEAQLESGEECPLQADARLVWALLPSGAEWGAARAALAPAPRRAQLVRRVCRAAEAPMSIPAARYHEQGACALAAAAAREHGAVHTARALAPLFAHNAYLALACSGTSLWWSGVRPANPTGGPVFSTHVCALSHIYPALLRAAASNWQPQDAARAVAACGRAARSGAGGPLLHVARLEAEARAPRPRPAPALLTAVDDYPHHKWSYVRGAAWCGAEGGALADALLERALRLHALRDELAPPPAPPTDTPLQQ